MSPEEKTPPGSGEGPAVVAGAGPTTVAPTGRGTAVEVEINGSVRRVESDPNRSLLWVLRDELGLTGSKYGCGEGQCGACTVLVDGVARNSCITPLAAVSGKSVTTIEGLAGDGELHPLQRAFLEEEALQCGYCTPGMIMAAASLLRRSPDPSEAEIVRAMQENVCRCGTYRRIVAAIRRAAAGTTGSGTGGAGRVRADDPDPGAGRDASEIDSSETDSRERRVDASGGGR